MNKLFMGLNCDSVIVDVTRGFIAHLNNLYAGDRAVSFKRRRGPSKCNPAVIYITDFDDARH